MVLVPHFIKGFTIFFSTKGYNNIDPRKGAEAAIQRLTDADDASKKATARFISRCIGCHQNSWEALAFFTAGVLAVKAVGLGGDLVKQLSLAFLAVRALYIMLYLGGTSRPVAGARSIAWAAGTVISFTLMILAARKATADEASA